MYAIVADPDCCPPTVLILPTDQEPGTGKVGGQIEAHTTTIFDSRGPLSAFQPRFKTPYK